MQCQTDPVVRHPSLRKIIGTDALTAVTGTHLAPAIRRNCMFLCLTGLVKHTGPQHLHRLFLILELGFLILALHHDARRQMRDADSRLRTVDVLSARTGCTVGVDAQIIRIDLDLNILDLRQHCYRNRRRMDTPARLRDRHPLNPMRTALVFQLAVRAKASYHERDFLETANLRRIRIDKLRAPPLTLSKTRIHPEQIAGKQSCLIAAHAAADLHDDILIIIWVLRQQQDWQLLIQYSLLLLEIGQFFLYKLAHLIIQRLIEHRPIIGDSLNHLLIDAKLLHDWRQTGMLLAIALPALNILNGIRVTDQRLQLHIFILNSLKLFEHKIHLNLFLKDQGT